jgi:hypothetical protein
LLCIFIVFLTLSVLSDGLGTSDILSSQEPLVRAVMEEVAAMREDELKGDLG